MTDSDRQELKDEIHELFRDGLAWLHRGPRDPADGSTTVPFVVSTVSFLMKLGYRVPPGEWEFFTNLTLQQGPPGEQMSVWSTSWLEREDASSSSLPLIIT